jgi:hypothetical protein
MSSIFFKPWRGPNYEYGGLFSKRILILGESHYQWDEKIPLTESLTIECIKEQISGDYTSKFWTNIAITFLNRYPSLEEKQYFWYSVAFYNYIQENVGFGPRVRPTSDMWITARNGFEEVLEDFKPQCIIVLGYKLWENLPGDGIQGPNIENAKQKETCKYLLSNGDYSLAYGIRHPSAGFSGWYWHPFVMRAIEIA